MWQLLESQGFKIFLSPMGLQWKIGACNSVDNIIVRRILHLGGEAFEQTSIMEKGFIENKSDKNPYCSSLRKCLDSKFIKLSEAKKEGIVISNIFSKRRPFLQNLERTEEEISFASRFSMYYAMLIEDLTLDFQNKGVKTFEFVTATMKFKLKVIKNLFNTPQSNSQEKEYVFATHHEIKNPRIDSVPSFSYDNLAFSNEKGQAVVKNICTGYILFYSNYF